MKTRADRILLAVLLLSAILYASAFISELAVDVVDPFFSAGRVQFLFVFHAVPSFCLQLLLCRNMRRLFVRLIPLLLIVLVAVLCAVGAARAVGLVGLGWVMLLLLCIAPMVGILLAWAVYGAQRFRQHING